MKKQIEPNQKYVLLKFTCNRADEFDVHGYTIKSVEQWNALKLELDIFFSKLKEGSTLTSGFGTNQELTFSSAKEVLDSVEEIQLGYEEVLIYQDSLGLTFGYTPYLSYKLNEEDYYEWGF